MDDNKFWLAVWGIIVLGIGILMIAARFDSDSTAELCKYAIEQKSEYAIAKTCR